MKTVQKTLRLRDPRYLAPTMTVEAARGILGMDEDEVCEAVDDGKLVAWDIGADGERRRELRILTESVARVSDPDAAPITGPEACALVATGDKPWITGRELARALCCSGTHVIKLIEVGDLALVPGTVIKRGKEGTPRITRASVGAFLRGRMEGGYSE